MTPAALANRIPEWASRKSTIADTRGVLATVTPSARVKIIFTHDAMSRHRVGDPFGIACFYRENSATLPIRGRLSRGQSVAISTRHREVGGDC
jgi:hypothetical protein